MNERPNVLRNRTSPSKYMRVYYVNEVSPLISDGKKIEYTNLLSPPLNERIQIKIVCSLLPRTI